MARHLWRPTRRRRGDARLDGADPLHRDPQLRPAGDREHGDLPRPGSPLGGAGTPHGAVAAGARLMAPRLLGPRRRFVSARDGLRLAALDWAGPAHATPLLCLSGISRSGIDFLHVAEHFAGTRRIVAL